MKAFKAKNLGFKPNIGDFGAGFWGIRINILLMYENRESACLRLVCGWVPVTGQGGVDRSTENWD